LETTPEFRSMYKPAGRGKDTKALVEAVAAGNTGMQMGKSTANRVVHQLLGHDVMDYIWDNAHLPDFIEKAKECDPSGYYHFESVPLGMIEGVQSLYRVIWINGGVVRGFGTGSDFLGLFIMDGAHLYNPFGGCLMQVVAQDAGKHIVPLARAIVPIENTENANWVLEAFLSTFPEGAFKVGMADEGSSFMAHEFQDKLGEWRIRWCICTNHVADNLQGKNMRELLKSVGKARTEEYVDNAIEEIRKVNAKSATKVEKKKELLAPHYLLRDGAPRGGVHTNSIVESAHNMIDPWRQMGPCEMIHGTLVYDAQQNDQYLMEARQCKTVLTPKWYEFALDVHKKSFKYFVDVTSCSKNELIGLVTHLKKNTTRSVTIVWNAELNRYEIICECRHFDEHGVPCAHAYRLIEAGHRKLGRREFFWDMKELYKPNVLTSSWIRQHEVPIVLIPRAPAIPKGLSAKKAVFGLLAEIQHESNDSSAIPLLPLYPMQYVPRGGRPKKTKSQRTAKKYRRNKGHKEQRKRGRPSKLLFDEEGEEEDEEEEEEEEEDDNEDMDSDCGEIDEMVDEIEINQGVQVPAKRVTRCTHCGKPGHNRLNCPRPDTLRLLCELKLLPKLDESSQYPEVKSIVCATSDWLELNGGLYSKKSWQHLGYLMRRYFDDYVLPGISSICLPGFKIKRIRFNVDVEMEQDDDEVQPQWEVGTILEAEMMDPKFVVYYGTIHPVRVVRVIPETNEYECALLAFGGVDTDLWDASLLHVPRDGQPRIPWKPGDTIHCRIRNRIVRGVKGVDGDASDAGIWVKGVINSHKLPDGQHYLVKHSSWTGDQKATMTAKVHVNDIRREYE
jgi:hypothetical protein